MNDSLYRIIGLSRRPDVSLGACTFSISLDAEFARKCRELAWEHQLRFEENMRKIVGYKYARATFLDGSIFLRSMSVEGNCACMGVDGSMLGRDWSGERAIFFNGHNIDSKQQAFDILTIFTYWIDTAEAFLT